MVEFHYRMAVLEAERAFIADLAARIRDRSIGGYDIVGAAARLLSDGVGMEELIGRIAGGDFGQEAADLLTRCTQKRWPESGNSPAIQTSVVPSKEPASTVTEGHLQWYCAAPAARLIQTERKPPWLPHTRRRSTPTTS